MGPETSDGCEGQGGSLGGSRQVGDMAGHQLVGEILGRRQCFSAPRDTEVTEAPERTQLRQTKHRGAGAVGQVCSALGLRPEPLPQEATHPRPLPTHKKGRHPEWARGYSFKSLNSHFDKYLIVVPISTRWVNSVPGQRFSTDSCPSDIISTMTRETWGQKQIVVGESESC